MKTKICSKCGKEKLLSNFHKCKKGKFKRKSVCKLCRKKQYKNNYTQIKKYQKLHKKEIDINRQKYYQQYPWRKTLERIKQRCNNPKNDSYKNYGGRGIKCLITEEEVKELWFRDKASEMKKPSIDRIDNDGDYTFDNCRFIEMSENTSIRFKKLILQFDLEGNFIKEWESLKSVASYLKLSPSNLCQKLSKSKNKINNFIWKFKK